MSNYQLRQRGEARKALARGLEIAEKKLPKIESRDLRSFWHEWVFAHVLRHEAKALIEGGAKAGEATTTSDPSPLRKGAP